MARLLSEEDLMHMDGRKVFTVPVVDGEATFDSEYKGLGWGTVDVGNNRIWNDVQLGYWTLQPDDLLKVTLCKSYYFLAFDHEVTPERAALANKKFRLTRGLDH